MTKEAVFEVIKKAITDILPDISENEIKIEGSLKDYGANSIDRMDIIVSSMETLGLRIPLVEFGQLKNIQGVVDLLYEKKLCG